MTLLHVDEIRLQETIKPLNNNFTYASMQSTNDLFDDN